ncbi:MAG: hypothetical protein ACKO0Z_18260, partial [Betaproteobacteria bacterium]
PGIVVEPWRNSSFKLRLTWNETIEETEVIDFNASADKIQSALESLSSIGVGLVVTGTILPGNIDIEFATPTTALQDIPLLEVVDSESFRVDVLQKGTDTQNEIQRIVLHKGPSRVVVSAVSELIEPDAWGVNWNDRISYNPTLGYRLTMDGDNLLGEVGIDIFGECDGPKYFDHYGIDGYRWGRGLTNVISAQFLLNLLSNRDEY